MSWIRISLHGVWKSQKKSHSTFASEASYAYILYGQKLLKMSKQSIWWADGQTVVPDMPILIWQKLMENANISNETYLLILKLCALVKIVFARKFKWI